MSATIYVYKILSKDILRFIDFTFNIGNEEFRETIITNNDGLNIIKNEFNSINMIDDNKYVVTSVINSEDFYKLNNKLDDINANFIVFYVDKNLYGKRSHAYKEDNNKIKELSNTSNKNVIDFNNTNIVIVKEIHYMQGWFFSNKFFKGTRSYYLGFTKNQVTRLIKDMINFNKTTYDSETIKSIKNKLSNIVDNFIDNEMIFEISY